MSAPRRKLSPRELVAVPAWPASQVRGLPGRCRGVMLRDWAQHVRDLWGDEAVTGIRAVADVTPEQLPDHPDRQAWYPVGYQIAVTRAIAERHLDGDLLALEPMLLAAGTRVRDRVVQWAMRRAGPRLIFKNAHRIHADVYDLGACTSRVERGYASLSWRGAAFFGNPTWRSLQLFGIRSAVTLVGRKVMELTAIDLGDEAFGIDVRWVK